MTGWYSIETAPRDGSFVLAYSPRCEPPVSIATYEDEPDVSEDRRWSMIEIDCMASCITPTHWMPLPDAPVATPLPHDAPRVVESRRAVTLSGAAAELPVSA